MSKKHITEAVENMNDLPADLGPMMKALGTVLTDEFQKRNGIFANKEERNERKNEPLAEVETSDIQVRFGNRLITLMPAVEGKPMISIPVGSSDKATPATIPREWMIGTMIDGLLSIFEGQPDVVWQYVGNINQAINNATHTDEEGRMKVVVADLPAHVHSVEVAEMLQTFKRSFRSRSAGSAKLNFSFEVTELERVQEPEVQVVKPLVPDQTSMAERLLSHSNDMNKQVAAEVSHTPSPEPEVHAPANEPAMHGNALLATAEDQLEEDAGSPSSPWNLKLLKTDVEGYLSSFAANAGGTTTLDHVAHGFNTTTQSLKRLIEEHFGQHPHGILPDWETIESDDRMLKITCTRSPTGRFARGKPIIVSYLPEHEEFVTASEHLRRQLPPNDDGDEDARIIAAEREHFRGMVEEEFNEIIADAEPWVDTTALRTAGTDAGRFEMIDAALGIGAWKHYVDEDGEWLKHNHDDEQGEGPHPAKCDSCNRGMTVGFLAYGATRICSPHCLWDKEPLDSIKEDLEHLRIAGTDDGTELFYTDWCLEDEDEHFTLDGTLIEQEEVEAKEAKAAEVIYDLTGELTEDRIPIAQLMNRRSDSQ